MEKICKKRFEAFTLVFFGAIMGSFGPPVFMKFVGGINRDVGIIYFLFLGGISMMAIRMPTEFRSVEAFGKLRKPMTTLRLLLAGLLTATAFVFFIMAIQAGSITETSVVVRLGPLFVVLLSVIFLHEHVKRWALVLLSVLLCVFGIAIFQGGSFASLKKVRYTFLLLALASALSQASRTVLQGYLSKHDKISSEFNSAGSMIIGSIFMCVYVFVNGGALVVPTISQFYLLLFLGLGTIALPIWLSLKAYSLNVSLGKIAFMDYVVPFSTAIIAYVLNGERGFNYPNLAIGFLLMSVGVFIVSKNVNSHSQQTEEDEVLFSARKVSREE